MKELKSVLITWVLSVLCYMSFITNGLTNSVDGLWASTYYQSGHPELGSGRWTLLFLDKARGGYAAEPFSTLLALLFIAIAVNIAIVIFSDKNKKTYMYGMLVPCSTVICCILAYRFTSSNYCLSIMFSMLAVWVIVKDYREKYAARSVLISIALMVLTLGIYQANLGCFCVVVIVYMMKLIINGENEKCFRVFKDSVIIGISSCLLYKLAWDICLKVRGITASNYNGADSVSIGTMILALPRQVALTYRYWYVYFRSASSNYLFAPIRVLIVIMLFGIVIVLGIKRLRSNPRNLVIYLLLCLMLPVAANISLILASSVTAVMMQMMVPIMLVLPVLLLYLDGLNLKWDKVICVFGALILYGNVYAVGTDIDALAQGSNSAYAIMNNIVATLNEKELLGSEYEYAVYGNISANELFKTNELYDKASKYAKFGTMQTKPDMVRFAYIGMLDDIGINLESVSYDTYQEILDSGVLDSLPAYPEKGSIIEKDGVVIIKVSDDYMWK